MLVLLHFKMQTFVAALLFINVCNCMLWQKGVVYFNINKLDYDIHSQDIITTTLAKLQNEICVKFFQLPPGNQTNVKILFISNPDKIKNCQPNSYDFGREVVTMPIGYKCINERSIARMVAEMLRASIHQTVSRVNSFDLLEKFREKDIDTSRPTLLSPVDRNFINAHYLTECGALSQRVHYRRMEDQSLPKPSVRDLDLVPEGLLTKVNVEYYKDKLWPLGIVMYGVEEGLRGTKDYQLLRHAMTSIELPTCIVFEEVSDDLLVPKNRLWFASEGADMPMYGFQKGKQTIKLSSMVNGAPGHTAHALNNLLRALGIHMMSNRYDRDNYVGIHWRHVVRGKERLLDKAPQESWLEQMPYDYDSATHAPANFACDNCRLGRATVTPLTLLGRLGGIFDLIWERTLTMGHRTDLSESDIELLEILYAKECRNRFSRDNLKE